MMPMMDMEAHCGPGDDTQPGSPAKVDSLDDVFGSAPASPVLEHGKAFTESTSISATHPSDIPRLRSIHVTNGYREGLASSKEGALQAGFDDGYALSAEIGLRAGILIGLLQGLDAAARSKGANLKTSPQETAREALDSAREELALERLLGDKYFGHDGVAKYLVDVPPAVGEPASPRHNDIANQHPLIKKWTANVQEFAVSLGRPDLKSAVTL